MKRIFDLFTRFTSMDLSHLIVFAVIIGFVVLLGVAWKH